MSGFIKTVSKWGKKFAPAWRRLDSQADALRVRQAVREEPQERLRGRLSQLGLMAVLIQFSLIHFFLM